MDNRPLPVIAESGGHVAFVHWARRLSRRRSRSAMPLSLMPGRGAFVLPVPAAASVTVTIDVPGDQTDVHLSTGLILRRSRPAGRTTIEATLHAGTPTEVWWSTHDSVPTTGTARDVRLLSDVKSIVRSATPTSGSVPRECHDRPGRAVADCRHHPRRLRGLSVSGASLERSRSPGRAGHALRLGSRASAHQFLVSLERPTHSGLVHAS